MRRHSHPVRNVAHPGRQPIWGSLVGLVLLVVAAGCGTASPAPQRTVDPLRPAHPASRPNPASPSPTTTTSLTGTALPAICRAPKHLAPLISAGPPPTGFQVLDWLPATLSRQFPTIWAGLVARDPQNDLTFQETIRDPALETEVAHAYPNPAFTVVPYSAACLQAISTAINPLLGGPNQPLQLISVGIGKDTVAVASTACTEPAATTVQHYFQQRYGAAVTVSTCQAIPTAPQ